MTQTDSEQTNVKRQFKLAVRDLGRMPYAEAFELQRQLQRGVIEARAAAADVETTMHLLLVEHDPPVVTVSRRKTAAANLIATPAQLAAAGVEVAETDRGGDITYHGPGQLVVYPILDLNLLGLRLHGYMRLLEQIVIDTLHTFGIEGHRDPEATGVWVRGRDEGTEGRRDEAPRAASSPTATSSEPPTPAAKICAMGVRVSRWVTMHGLALNVKPNLDHFQLIVPCGLVGRSVTSMKQQLGERCPTMDTVKAGMVERFKNASAAGQA